MKRKWTPEELNEFFTLMSQDIELIETKSGENRLGFAVMLKFFEYEGKFPDSERDIPVGIDGLVVP